MIGEVKVKWTTRKHVVDDRWLELAASKEHRPQGTL
jgi:hypothetical protein